MGLRSIRTLGATLAIVACPCLAASQGIPVRKFQSAADFAKAMKLQRLANGAAAFPLPSKPQGIPGYYDPSTKTFTIAAASQLLLPLAPPTSSMKSAAAAEPCTLNPGDEHCTGQVTVDINITTVSPGIKKGDTVFCTVEVALGRALSIQSNSLIPDDAEEQRKNFGVGQNVSITIQFASRYENVPKNLHQTVYLEIETTCSIPSASDGNSYGPQEFTDRQPAERGAQSAYANLTF